MAAIHEFEVVEPPTSQGVEASAYEAVLAHSLLELVILGHQEVPKPQETPISIRIAQMLYSGDGGMTNIIGFNEEHDSVIINLSTNPSLAATVSMVLR